MKSKKNIIILSPNIKRLFKKDQISDLKKAGNLILVEDIVAWNKISPLKTNNPKVLGIDPDFCDWNVPDEVITTTKNIQSICLQSTSFRWINTDLAKKENVPITNLRGFSSQAVAEWAVMNTLMLSRKFPQITKDSFASNYDTQRGMEIKGKTVGIIGLGSIGTAIGTLLKGMGTNVTYYSRHSQNSNFTRTSLKKIFTQSDIIFPTFAVNDDTRKLITDDHILSMKSTALFVTIINQSAYNHSLVIDRVNQSKLGGYAFESTQAQNMTKHPGNILLLPENAWVTSESMDRNAQAWTQSIIDASHGKFPTKIN